MKENEKELLQKALEKSKNENGVLIVPKEIAIIDEEFSELCLKFEVSSIKFEEYNMLEEIGYASFYRNDFLTYADFSNCKNLKKICKGAFIKCQNLKTANFSGCSNLQSLGALIFMDCNLDLLDFSGCKNISFFDDTAIHTKVARFNYNLEETYEEQKELQDRICSFHTTFYRPAHIELYDEKIKKDEHGNKTKVLTKVEEFTLPYSNIDHLLILHTGTYKRLQQLAKIKELKNIPTNPIRANIFKNKHEAEGVAYNWKMFDELHEWLGQNTHPDSWTFLPKQNPFGYFGVDWNDINYRTENKLDNNYRDFAYATYNTFRILGLMGFDGIDKKKVLQYKILLSKEYLKSQSKPLTQEAIQKVAKTVDFKDLIKSFILTKIVPHKNKHRFLVEMHRCAIHKTMNIDFAMFLVNNIDEILSMPSLNKYGPTNWEFDDMKNGTSLSVIYKYFDEFLKNSNKKVLTRQNKQRLTLEDCKFSTIYNKESIKEGNEDLAKLCGAAHINQEGFEFLQKVFEDGKKIVEDGSQVLKCCPDTSTSDITYEILEKDNPLGLVLGNITNCCQQYSKAGETCMVLGQTHPASTFVVFRHKGDIIAQSWMWYDDKNKLVALDNIEVLQIAKKLINTKEKQNVEKCLQRLCENILKTMNEKEIIVENIVIGKNNTDFKFLGKMYPCEKDKEKMYQCPYVYENGKKIYSDVAKDGQFLVYQNGEPQFLGEDFEK